MPPIRPATRASSTTSAVGVKVPGRRTTRAQPERAVVHALRDERAHLVQLGARRRPIDFAHHFAAHRTLADEHREVGGDALRLHLGEKRRERNRRAAVGAFDQRGDALPHVVVGGRDLEDAAARVGVDVDEAGCDDQAARVDLTSGLALDPRRDLRDCVAPHRDLAAIPRAGGAVDDAGVADDEVVGCTTLRVQENGAGQEQAEEKEACAHPRTIARYRGLRTIGTNRTGMVSRRTTPAGVLRRIVIIWSPRPTGTTMIPFTAS